MQKGSTPRNDTPDQVTITSVQRPSHRRNNSSVSAIPTFKSPSGIPSLRSPMPGLSERPNSGNVRKLPPQPAASGSPEKPITRLRLQSPQKLRERVQNNQKIFENAGASFQDEIAKITAEINGSRSPGTAAALAPLESKVNALATTHNSVIAGLRSKLDTLSSEMISSLQVSEARYKKLDELWKETSAENEILYSRFNEELAKLMSRIAKGEGVEELRGRFAESQEENARLKRENARLRRENLGLKSQLRE